MKQKETIEKGEQNKHKMEEPIMPRKTKLIIEKDRQQTFTSEQIQKFMRLALEQAKKAFSEDQVPVGCIFVNTTTKQVVASSHNLTNQLKNASKHCQINCITQMTEKGLIQQCENDKNLQNFTLFVTVQPCIMCSYALNIMKIGKVYFGQYNDRFGGCGSVLKTNQYPFKGGILQQQSLQVLKTFYERGNQRIPEQMRNKSRKRVKGQE